MQLKLKHIFTKSMSFLYLVGISLFLWNSNIFFQIDPDAIYLGNILAFLSGKQVYYIDHPGTFYIQLMAIALLPFRISSVIMNKSFIEFAVDNMHLLLVILKVVSSLFYVFTFYLYTKTIMLITKSVTSVLVFLVGITTVSIFPKWLFVISPESIILLLSGLWIWITANLTRGFYNRKITFLILYIITGLAIASKLSAYTIILTTLIFDFLFHNQFDIKKRLIIVSKHILIAISAFLIGTWPIINRFHFFRNWIAELFLHVGLHGTSKKSIFDLNSYLSSIKIQITKDTVVYILLLALPIIFILVRSNFNKFYRKYSILFWSIYSSVVIGVFATAKYYTPHYQIINYTLIIFLFSLSGYIIDKYALKYCKNTRTVLLLIFSVLLLKNSFQIFQVINRANNKQVFINKYYDSQQTILWSGGPPLKENMLLFGNNFSHVYDDVLKKIDPKVKYYYDPNQKVINYMGIVSPLENFCWTNAFISSEDIDEFKEYFENDPNINIIEDSKNKIYFITRQSHLKCYDLEDI